MELQEKFLGEAEARLSEIEKEIESKTGPLLAEQKTTQAIIKKLKKATGKATTAAPVTPDEDLFAAIGELTSGDKDRVTSSDVAGHLGIDPRSIARRLSNHAKDGTVIVGDKELGYSLA